MPNTFFISDHHLGHKNILNFVNESGGLLRLGFNSIEAHDHYIIDKHNATVHDTDLVYFLGDVTWKTNKNAREQIAAMNGRKRLCVGNHDDVDFLMSTGAFERIYLWKYFPEYNLIASHVPLAETDLKRGQFNVHGHLHDNAVRTSSGKLDLRYFNVCVEQNHYTPVQLPIALTCFCKNG